MDDQTKADLFETFAAFNPYNDAKFVDRMRKFNLAYNDGNGNINHKCIPPSMAADFLRGETWALAERKDENPFMPVRRTSKAIPGLESMLADAYHSLKFDTSLQYSSQARYAKMWAQRLFNRQSKQKGENAVVKKLRDKLLRKLEALTRASNDDEIMLCLIQIWAFSLFAENDNSLHRRTVGY